MVEAVGVATICSPLGSTCGGVEGEGPWACVVHVIRGVHIISLKHTRICGISTMPFARHQTFKFDKSSSRTTK